MYVACYLYHLLLRNKPIKKQLIITKQYIVLLTTKILILQFENVVGVYKLLKELLLSFKSFFVFTKLSSFNRKSSSS